jgi:hypothetical protein
MSAIFWRACLVKIRSGVPEVMVKKPVCFDCLHQKGEPVAFNDVINNHEKIT